MEQFKAGIASGLFHVAMLAVMSMSWASAPVAQPVQQGRASVALMASMAAAPPQEEEQEEQEEEWLRKLRVQRVEVQAPESPEAQLTGADLPATRRHDVPIPVAVADVPMPPVEVPPAPAESQDLDREETERQDEAALVVAEGALSRQAPASWTPTAQVELEAEVATPSPASIAQTGANVDAPPRPFTNPSPVYPEQALREGHQGRVLLRVLVGATGAVEQVQVEDSSGVPALDQSAQSAVRRWRFTPASRGGQAVAATVFVPVRFRIGRG